MVSLSAQLTSSFGALRHRDFRLFWIGSCVSFIGSWVQMVATGLYVYQTTGSKQWLGIMGLAGGLPTTVFMLFGGVVADRANKRRLVLATQSAFALTSIVLAVLLWMDRLQMWHLVASALLNGLIFAVDGPARQAIVYDLVGGDDLATGVALQSAAFNVARVIGPMVGGAVYAAFGAAWCFFLNGLSFLAIIWAVAAVRSDISRTTDADQSVWYGLMEGVSHLRANRPMRTVVGLTAVTSLTAFSVYQTLMPAYAKDLLGIGDRDARYGLLFSAMGAGALIGVYIIGRMSAAGRRGLLMMVAALVFGSTLPALGHTRLFPVAILVLVVLGCAAIGQLATANTLTQTLAPDRLRGRAVSTHMFAMGGLQPFGSFVAGAVAQQWGVPFALTAGGVVMIAYTAGVWILRKNVAELA